VRLEGVRQGGRQREGPGMRQKTILIINSFIHIYSLSRRYNVLCEFSRATEAALILTSQQENRYISGIICR
jgi:hypothetical protein